MLAVNQVCKGSKVGADGMKCIANRVVDRGLGEATREEVVTVHINLVGTVTAQGGGWGVEKREAEFLSKEHCIEVRFKSGTGVMSGK